MTAEEKLNQTMDLLLKQEEEAQFFLDTLETEYHEYWEGKRAMARHAIDFLRSMGITSKR